MEKFGTWRDPGTGIYPFLSKTQTQPAFQRVLKDFILGPIIAILRLLLIFIIGTWMMFVTFLHQLIPSQVLKRGFKRYTYSMGARSLLLLMGFWWISTSEKTLKKGRKEAIKSNTKSLQAGDLIISNYTSYIEILYLAFRFSPQFVKIYMKDGKAYVLPISLQEAIIDCVSKPNLTLPSDADQKLMTLEEYSEICPEPIAVFPEASTSNGKTILKFTPILNGFDHTKKQVQVVAFRYEYEYFCPSFTIGSPLGHLFKMCCQVYNSLEVFYLPRDENFELGNSDVSEQVSTNIANLLRVKRAQLSAQEKIGFWEFYNQKSSIKKGYKVD